MSLAWNPGGQQLAVLTEHVPDAPAATPPANPPANPPPPKPRLQFFDRDGNWAGSPFALSGDVEGFAWNPISPIMATFGGPATIITLTQPGGGLGTGLVGHPAKVTDLIWAPDGEALASVDRGNNLLLWERGGMVGAAVPLGNNPLMAWSWSPDSQALAFAAGYQATAPRLWFRKTRRVTPEPAPGMRSRGTPRRSSCPPRRSTRSPGRPTADDSPRSIPTSSRCGPRTGGSSAQIGRSIHWHPKTGAGADQPARRFRHRTGREGGPDAPAAPPVGSRGLVVPRPRDGPGAGRVESGRPPRRVGRVRAGGGRAGLGPD